MNIIIIPSWFPNQHNRISGSYFYTYAKVLSNLGLDVGFIVPDARQIDRKFLRQSITDLIDEISFATEESFPTWRLRIWRWLPNLKRQYLAKLFCFGEEAYELFEQTIGKPDVIHAHSVIYGGALAAHLGKKYKIPVVISEHSSNVLRKKLNNFQLSVAGDAYHSCSKITAVSPSVKESIIYQWPDLKVDLLPNPVDNEVWQPQEMEIVPQPFIYTFIGQIIPLKRLDLLLPAFKKVLSKYPNSMLWIIGDGFEKNTIVKLSKSLSIDKNVTFFGFLPQIRVVPLIQKSHVIVSTSDVETFSIGLIEAMSCGKPIVSTMSGGPQSIVTEQVGLLVPTGDIDAISQALVKIQENYSLYDFKKISEICRNLFGLNSFGKRLISIYSEVIDLNPKNS